MNRTGAERIADERRRQVEELGWSDRHDDRYVSSGALVRAAVCYAAQAAGTRIWERRDGSDRVEFFDPFPWDYDFDARARDGVSNVICDGPRDESHRLRLLEKAGALIAAEIDRLVRSGSQP